MPLQQQSNFNKTTQMAPGGLTAVPRKKGVATIGLTVVGPAGVEHILGVRGEAHVQDAPANVASLHRSP